MLEWQSAGTSSFSAVQQKLCCLIHILSVKIMPYLRETVYLYELVCFFADASGGIFLRWCTGLLKNISRLGKDSELRKNTRLLLQNHVKVSLMPL